MQGIRVSRSVRAVVLSLVLALGMAATIASAKPTY
jgi:hypothetical protein